MKIITFTTASGSEYKVEETGRYTVSGESIGILQKSGDNFFLEVEFSNSAIKGMPYRCKVTDNPVNMENKGGIFVSSEITYARGYDNGLTPAQQKARMQIGVPTELEDLIGKGGDDGSIQMEFAYKKYDEVNKG